MAPHSVIHVSPVSIQIFAGLGESRLLDLKSDVALFASEEIEEVLAQKDCAEDECAEDEEDGRDVLDR